MEYRDFVVEASDARVEKIEKNRVVRYKVCVLSSPTREMTAAQAASVDYDDKVLQLELARLDAYALDGAGLVRLGRTLAALLFPPAANGAIGVREILAENMNALGADRGLRLCLRLPPLLAALPWEFAYLDRAGGGDGIDGFIALDPRIAIVRHQSEALVTQAAPVRGPIKIIAALASPQGFRPLDLAKERLNLEQAFKDNSGVKPIFLPDATLSEILTAATAGAHVFHFAGHGAFLEEETATPGAVAGTGKIALDDQLVAGDQLAVNLRGHGIRLAVLGGCETGRRDNTSTWTGIAPALVKAEIPAVVANQFSITDTCAIAFSRQFYLALVGGLSIEQAVSAGRIAAFNADKTGRDWGVPVLYLRGAAGLIFAGAADPAIRERARSGAEAEVKLRVNTVAAGGSVLGAQVGKIINGRLSVDIHVDGTVYGNVIGARVDRLGTNSHVNVDQDLKDVGPGGSVIGITIGETGTEPGDE